MKRFGNAQVVWLCWDAFGTFNSMNKPFINGMQDVPFDDTQQLVRKRVREEKLFASYTTDRESTIIFICRVL